MVRLHTRDGAHQCSQHASSVAGNLTIACLVTISMSCHVVKTNSEFIPSGKTFFQCRRKEAIHHVCTPINLLMTGLVYESSPAWDLLQVSTQLEASCCENNGISTESVAINDIESACIYVCWCACVWVYMYLQHVRMNCIIQDLAQKAFNDFCCCSDCVHAGGRDRISLLHTSS